LEIYVDWLENSRLEKTLNVNGKKKSGETRNCLRAEPGDIVP